MNELAARLFALLFGWTAIYQDAMRYRYLLTDPYLFEEMGVWEPVSELNETVDWAMAGGRKRGLNK